MKTRSRIVTQQVGRSWEIWMLPHEYRNLSTSYGWTDLWNSRHLGDQWYTKALPMLRVVPMMTSDLPRFSTELGEVIRFSRICEFCFSATELQIKWQCIRGQKACSSTTATARPMNPWNCICFPQGTSFDRNFEALIEPLTFVPKLLSLLLEVVAQMRTGRYTINTAYSERIPIS